VETVVETPTYPAIANKLFSERERADVVALVAADPECGDLIRRNGRVSKGPRGTQGNGEKWRGAVRVYLAEREISGFSYCRFSEECERKPVDGRAQHAKETGRSYFRDLREIA